MLLLRPIKAPCRSSQPEVNAMRLLRSLLIVLPLALAACAPSAPDPTATPLPAPTSLPARTALPIPQPGPPPAALPPPAAINLDAPTQALIAHAKRTVF